MSHSIANHLLLVCPQCGHEFKAEIWQVIDAAERPDLLESIRNGTLHAIGCPQCGSVGDVDVSFLLYRPDEYPVLIFCPAIALWSGEEADEEAIEEQMNLLLTYLEEALGAAWQEEWAADMEIMSPLMLPVFISGDPAAAMQQMTDEFREKLNQIREDDPEAYAEGMAMLDAMETVAPPEMFNLFTSPLANTLDDFMDQPSWEESYAFLKAHPELLGEEAEEMLSTVIDSANRMGDEEAAGYMEEHLLLLRRCREIGVREAFAEKIGIAPDELA